MTRFFIIFIPALLAIHTGVFGQPSLTFDLKKPPKFQERKLGSEKSANKKFTVPRRFMQNTVTHYNFYFNANNKLNEILARAKASHKEDFSQLLPFYNYDLTVTSAFKSDLDSVIYKSTAGVLLHDLRNDWVDNLYILIGKSYYLRNELDSAYLTFQYVNYAFSPKEKDGYDKVIGSNQNEGSNAFSISTRENPNVVKKVFSTPPSRNESFVWQVRTYLAKDEFAEAAGLIETLKNDPFFPERLQTDLNEVQALWFYKQRMYDSAALYLEKSLSNAVNQQELSRWEYLLAQLYERSGHNSLAKDFFDRSVRHTLNPVQEVYARLNSIRQDMGGDEKSIQESIDRLVRMARKDRYRSYRDIIYYSAALIENERNKPENAIFLLQQSIASNFNNEIQKSKSFLTLADISFTQKLYPQAKMYYDSVNTQIIAPEEMAGFNARKLALTQVVTQENILQRQDSMQRIAAMPEAEREVFIRNIVKQLRKKQGLKDTDAGMAMDASFASNNNNAAPDLFGDNKSKGDWYFYNPALKSKGLTEFKVKWGTRPNVDNWRRMAAVQGASMGRLLPESTDPALNLPLMSSEITYESLLNNVPLTPEKVTISQDSMEHALFALGRAYMNGLEDYPSAIDAFEHLISGYTDSEHTEEAWFNLYYLYGKTGNTNRLAQIKQMLSSKYPEGKFTKLLNNPNPAMTPDSIQKMKVTRLYEGIYNLFIEGKFAEALKNKKAADSVYGPMYWTPQLLYIEAIYYIRQREDSVARQVLSKSLQLHPFSIMQPKTANLLAVLGRRKEIEEYLTNLRLDMPKEEEAVAMQDIKPVTPQPKPEPEVVKDTVVQEPEIKMDRSQVKAGVLKKAKDDVAVSGKPKQPSLKLPPPMTVTPPAEDTQQVVKIPEPVVTPPADTQVAKVAEPVKETVIVPEVIPPARDSVMLKDTVARAPEKEVNVAVVKPSDVPAVKPELNTNKLPVPGADKLPTVKKPAVTNSVYSNNPHEPYYVVLVLDKVDPVYATEARNAFNRFHKENYPSKNIQVSSLALTEDIKLVMMKNFENAAAALDYIEKTRKLTELDILPWLTPQKYSFIMLAESNVEALKTTKDIPAYKKFLNQVYPGTF